MDQVRGDLRPRRGGEDQHRRTDEARHDDLPA